MKLRPRRFRVKYSESEEYIVYRKFHYSSRGHGIRGFLATTFSAVAIFLLMPLPDEIIVIPALAKLVISLQPMEFSSAAIYAYGIYKGLGLLFLALALVFGVQYLKESFDKKVRHIKKAHKDIGRNVKNAHAKTKATVKKHLSAFF